MTPLTLQRPNHRLDGSWLRVRSNAMLAATGYNFGRLLRWLGRLLRALFRALLAALPGLRPA